MTFSQPQYYNLDGFFEFPGIRSYEFWKWSLLRYVISSRWSLLNSRKNRTTAVVSGSLWDVIPQSPFKISLKSNRQHCVVRNNTIPSYALQISKHPLSIQSLTSYHQTQNSQPKKNSRQLTSHNELSQTQARRSLSPSTRPPPLHEVSHTVTTTLVNNHTTSLNITIDTAHLSYPSLYLSLNLGHFVRTLDWGRAALWAQAGSVIAAHEKPALFWVNLSAGASLPLGLKRWGATDTGSSGAREKEGGERGRVAAAAGGAVITERCACAHLAFIAAGLERESRLLLIIYGAVCRAEKR